MSDKVCNVNNIYKLDGRVPVIKAIPFGIQHILAMFVANLTPITIIAGSRSSIFCSYKQQHKLIIPSPHSGIGYNNEC